MKMHKKLLSILLSIILLQSLFYNFGGTLKIVAESLPNEITDVVGNPFSQEEIGTAWKLSGTNGIIPFINGVLDLPESTNTEESGSQIYYTKKVGLGRYEFEMKTDNVKQPGAYGDGIKIYFMSEYENEGNSDFMQFIFKQLNSDGDSYLDIRKNYDSVTMNEGVVKALGIDFYDGEYHNFIFEVTAGATTDTIDLMIDIDNGSATGTFIGIPFSKTKGDMSIRVLDGYDISLKGIIEPTEIIDIIGNPFSQEEIETAWKLSGTNGIIPFINGVLDLPESTNPEESDSQIYYTKKVGLGKYAFEMKTDNTKQPGAYGDGIKIYFMSEYENEGNSDFMQFIFKQLNSDGDSYLDIRKNNDSVTMNEGVVKALGIDFYDGEYHSFIFDVTAGSTADTIDLMIDIDNGSATDTFIGIPFSKTKGDMSIRVLDGYDISLKSYAPQSETENGISDELGDPFKNLTGNWKSSDDHTTYSVVDNTINPPIVTDVGGKRQLYFGKSIKYGTFEFALKFDVTKDMDKYETGAFIDFLSTFRNESSNELVRMVFKRLDIDGENKSYIDIVVQNENGEGESGVNTLPTMSDLFDGKWHNYTLVIEAGSLAGTINVWLKIDDGAKVKLIENTDFSRTAGHLSIFVSENQDISLKGYHAALDDTNNNDNGDNVETGDSFELNYLLMFAVISLISIVWMRKPKRSN